MCPATKLLLLYLKEALSKSEGQVLEVGMIMPLRKNIISLHPSSRIVPLSSITHVMQLGHHLIYLACSHPNLLGLQTQNLEIPQS